MFILESASNISCLSILQMGFFFLTMILSSIATLAAFSTEAQAIKSDRLLDLMIRDYTLTFYKNSSKIFKTGEVSSIHLPGNLSSIEVNTVRFRCGSLTKYGAKVQEFDLGIGVTAHPCVERVILVGQNLGSNWSSLYYQEYNLSGYRLISNILGLLAFNDAGDNINFSTNPIEVTIQAAQVPIKIDFSNYTRQNNDTSETTPLCASFEHDGKVILDNIEKGNVCVSKKHGHFGLVMREVPPLEPLKRNVSRRKIAVVCSIGATLGAFLLGLLLVALFVKEKKKSRMEDIVRRAYEEEALQVSMAGHVRPAFN
ncbi:hypothetical protein LIER_21177 [Lithospermum erythrorhizon]|uniref:Transmembrane protein n=1 Tax=Lithospermum erythrorhizon TaxID=34254 RepID=A0AAV3QQH7_LITER